MTQQKKLYTFCVYTLRNRQDLDFIKAGDGKASFREKKTWKTTYKLLKDAENKSQKMPIFFGAADEHSGLIYFALIQDIQIESNQTTLYTFSELTEFPNTKPLSSLTLKSTGKKLSDQYIRPYAICKTPSQLSSWLKESGLPPIKKSRKTGQEPIHDNQNPLVPRLIDFWQWTASDLVSNATRGILAEFLVASALGLTDGIRSEWDAYDLLLPSGHKIEVKSSAHIQSWYQRKLSKISFSIPKTRAWNEDDNIQEKHSKRQADIYVFCLLKHKIQETLDPLDVSQWQFYVTPTALLNEHCGHTKQISLSKLKKIGAIPVTYTKLKDCIEEMAASLVGE